MSLNLFPARAYIGTFTDASGRQIGVLASPEFQRALNALRIRVGGDEALSLSDIETLLSFATPPDTETGKAIHDLQIEGMRDHTAEIAELRKTVEELKTQLACLTDQTAAVAEVKKYAQDLEISYSFAPPLTDWEHPGSIGAKTANAGAFTNLTTSSTCTVNGAFGCNGATAQTAYSVGAAATDLASVITLANNIRDALIANGIATT